MNDRWAAITGAGIVSPLGVGWEDFCSSLPAGNVALGEITTFDTEGTPAAIAGEISDFDLEAHINSVKTYLDRCSAFALAASAMALGDSRWIGNMPGADIGLCLGSAWGCQDTIQLYTRKLMESDPKFAPPLVFTHGYPNAPNSIVSIEFGLRGHNVCYAGGETAGAAAIERALEIVRRDPSQRLLAGGVEALSEVRVRMAQHEKRITSDLCRPFDSGADGLLPGEGAGMLAVESREAALAREAEILGYLAGCGTSGKRDRMAAAAEAVRNALKDAGLQANEIDTVFASASGLPYVDAAEASAIEELPGKPPVTALKSLFGEPEGSWAPQAIVAVLCCMESGVLPPVANLRQPINTKINIVREPLPRRIETALVLNVAASGYAAAIIVKRGGNNLS